MCPHVPKAVDQLSESLRADGSNGCYARFAKDTHVAIADDWHWHWLPPYQVVAAIHDEELRKRVTPALHEEYMLGLMRYLAEKADRDEITGEQLRSAFNAGWNWLQGKMKEEPILSRQNLGSRDGDHATRDRMASVAGGLATVATLALAISADDKAYQPAPANCYPLEARGYTIHCY